MNEKNLIARLLELAEDHEKHEQGGGCSSILREAADDLNKSASMLCQLENCVELQSDSDSVMICPVCRNGAIVGLSFEHDKDCALSQLISELSD
jgi:hypothetical protein